MPTLKEIRQMKGLSINEVADATGLHNTTISKVERGIINFTPRLYETLSTYYETTDIDDPVYEHHKESTEEVVKPPKKELGHVFTEEDCRAIREAREELGLTLKEVAPALGIDASTLCAYEKGRKSMIPETWNRIVEFYDLGHLKVPIFERKAKAVKREKEKQLALKKLKKDGLFANDELRQKLVDLRIQSGYSQTQVAELLGLGKSSVSEYETGARKLPIERVPMFIALYTGQLELPEESTEIARLEELHKTQMQKYKDKIAQQHLEIVGLRKRLKKALDLENEIIKVMAKLKDNYVSALEKITQLEERYDLNEMFEFYTNPRPEEEE